MSQSIHSVPRLNLPINNTRMVMRAMSGLQDARTFQEARDALLRYYYPILRTIRNKDKKNRQSYEEAEDWTMDVLHSGSATSAALFCKNVWGVREQVDPAIAQELAQCIEQARTDTTKTPYERVGQVLQWLKDTRASHPQLQWGHSHLRYWMQGLLTDFTLADAKLRPGALLAKPEMHYEALLASWASAKTGLPFDDIWALHSRPWFTPNSTNAGLLALSDEDNARQAAAKVYELRAKLHEESAFGVSLLTHTDIGVTRGFRPTWRDVTDYGVLHPLLTLDEQSFDKNVWMDWLQHQGKRWSSEANAQTWHAWQENAQASYLRVLQGHTQSTPNAIVYLGHDRINPLEGQIGSVPLDWFKVLTHLSERFAYLNQSPQLEALARQKLDPDALQRFLVQSKERVGQELIHALVELPSSLAQKNALNMPAWFHYQLQQAMTQKTSLELPDNLLDDDQTPPLY